MIRLRILGSIELVDSSGRELTAILAQPKRFALLAYLAAVGGGFARRDALLAMFWPELDDAHARSALNQAVRFLRKSLETPSVLLSRGTEDLAVSPAHLWCDLSAFRGALDGDRLAGALELYRDDLLAGFHCSGAPGFGAWLERERQHWRAEAARAARTLAARSEQAGSVTVAVNSARRAVELSATDERSVRELLSLLDRVGDRVGAIHAYEDFARRLAEEFDATPAPETVALIERIRARGVDSRHSRTSSSPSATPSLRPPGDALGASRDGVDVASRSRMPLERRWRRAMPIGGLVAAIALTVLALRIAPAGFETAGVASTDGVVAIAPFEILGAGDRAFWREGIVDVLSANLDGAGEIRTVSSSLAIRRWTGRADPASAEEFGHRLHARFVVFGRIVGTGRDSLRVSTTLYDVATHSTIDALDLTTSAERMDRLADSLSVRLLRALARVSVTARAEPPSTSRGESGLQLLQSTPLPARAVADRAARP